MAALARAAAIILYFAVLFDGRYILLPGQPIFDRGILQRVPNVGCCDAGTAARDS